MRSAAPGPGDAGAKSRPASGKDPDDRTEFAAERTMLANERTYAAWVRTGLAAFVTGLAALRFMQEVLTEWALAVVAVALLLFSLLSFVAAAWRYVHIGRRLSHTELPQFKSALVLAATALLGAASLVALSTALLK